MSYLPLNLAWWGNTTLGSHVFHFYFKDQAGMWTWSVCNALHWDPTGLLVYLAVVGMAFILTTCAGPLGHYLLVSPTLALTWGLKRLKARRYRGAAISARASN